MGARPAQTSMREREEDREGGFEVGWYNRLRLGWSKKNMHNPKYRYFKHFKKWKERNEFETAEQGKRQSHWCRTALDTLHYLTLYQAMGAWPRAQRECMEVLAHNRALIQGSCGLQPKDKERQWESGNSQVSHHQSRITETNLIYIIQKGRRNSSRDYMCEKSLSQPSCQQKNTKRETRLLTMKEGNAHEAPDSNLSASPELITGFSPHHL